MLLLLRVLNGGLPAQESLRTRPPDTLCLFMFYWGIFIFSNDLRDLSIFFEYEMGTIR